MSDVFVPPAEAGIQDVAAPAATAADQPGSSAELIETQIPVQESAPAADVDIEDGWSVSASDIEGILGAEEPAAEPEPEKEPETATPEEEPKTEDPAAEPTDDAKDKIQVLSDEEVENEKGLKNLRTSYNELKKQTIALQNNSLERAFLVDTPSFLSNLKEKSESKYNDLIRSTAQVSAETDPEGWINYFIQTAPDLLAKKLFGDDSATLDRVKAERAYIQEEHTDLFSNWEADSDKPAELPSPEKAELERLKAEQAKRDQADIETEVKTLYAVSAQPVIESVNRIISENGLDVSPDDTPEDKIFKEYINQLLPDYLIKKMSEDPEIAPIYNQADEFCKNRDRAGVLGLQLSLVNFAEEHAEKFISAMIGHRAKQDRALTQPKTAVPPPVALGAAAPAGNPAAAKPAPKPLPPATKNADAGEDDGWSVTAEDIRRIAPIAGR